jgi:cytochrome c553
MFKTASCLLLSMLAAGHVGAQVPAVDVAAGQAKAEAVCAACHGANGASVSDSIPNLAGQRVAYLGNQLKAWKDGTRKNPIMNAIAAQLSADDMANLAAFYAQLPAAGATKSALLPALSRTKVAFPADYKASYVKYHSINFPATKQVRHYYANTVAAAAAKAGKPVPDGAYLLVEVHSAKLDAEKKPVMGADGFFVADQLLFYTAMERQAGWGAEFPEILRNEDWQYAAFTAARQARAGVNQAECLACHKPLDKASYMFTIDKLSAARPL